MEEFLGILKVKVIRGKNLARRDMFSSDPYVKLSIGHQEVKTRVIKRDLNPEWNEELTLSIPNPPQPLKLQVFDKDTFSANDALGEAMVDLEPLAAAGNMMDVLINLENSEIRRIKTNEGNGLARDSCIHVSQDKLVQDVCVNLHNVESGQIELELKWMPFRS